MAQVLVMGFILALIASYLMRWAHGRHMMVARHQMATAASNGVESCLQEFQAACFNDWSAGAFTVTGIPGGPGACNVNYACVGTPGIVVQVTNNPGGGGNNNYRLLVRAPVAVP